MNKKIFALALAAALSAGASAHAQSAGGAANGDVKAGQRLFHADGCWECHGTAGQGGGGAGPRIAPMELPYEAFILQLRTPMNEMPPFEAKVTPDRDAADIYAYLKSIPAPRSPKDIPLLNE